MFVTKASVVPCLGKKNMTPLDQNIKDKTKNSRKSWNEEYKLNWPTDMIVNARPFWLPY